MKPLQINAEVETLLNELKQHQWKTNWRVADRLAQIGPPGVPQLIEALTSPDGYVRAAAAAGLGKIRDVRAIDGLVAAMNYYDEQTYEDDEDAEARVNAAEALAQIGDPSAVDPLITAASGEDRLVASYAIDGLGLLRQARAIPTLIAALNVCDMDVPKAASRALARIGSAAVSQLIESVESSTGHWRGYAIKSLGTIGDARARNCLKITQRHRQLRTVKCRCGSRKTQSLRGDKPIR